ncbi:unnamed protein product [Parascedosporium putredinis]|uniref:Uncharacterized protein n=1 Tax=Parascedosporium putredinis TaxID=1442378 RepID=A0A9P1MCZ1_9PEZI|nr:unnamed protein product [Parascedosporium putredinis]CAI8002536.1 unnamed protein product [Parascedosporium putredinis]
MSSLESKKRPRQFPGGFNGFPFGPGNFPGNFRGNAGPQIVATDPAARAGEFTSGFFQPPVPHPPRRRRPGAHPRRRRSPAHAHRLRNASSPDRRPRCPVVFPEAPISPAPESGFVDGDFSISVPPENSSVELVSEMVDASAAGEAAGLPLRAARAREPPSPQAPPRLPDADNMEKGLATSDTVSIRSSATTTSYSKAFNSIKAFVRPSTADQQTSYVPSISAPTAYSGPQADKLAVPLPSTWRSSRLRVCGRRKEATPSTRPWRLRR